MSECLWCDNNNNNQFQRNIWFNTKDLKELRTLISVNNRLKCLLELLFPLFLIQRHQYFLKKIYNQPPPLAIIDPITYKVESIQSFLHLKPECTQGSFIRRIKSAQGEHFN